MTVKELIETLKTCDENANVVIEQWDGDTFGIGVKMIEAVPMTAREANDKGHRIGNHSFEEDGYEVTFFNGLNMD